MSNQMTFLDSLSATSLPELQAGRLLSGSLDGQKASLLVPVVVHASHLVPPAVALVPPTPDTCGPSYSSSSANAAPSVSRGRSRSSASKSHPQRLSELSLRLLSLSRFKQAISVKQTSSQNDSLKAALSTTIKGGSLEYDQTWNRKVTPCGAVYWAHTASARRISDNASTGWQTPSAMMSSSGRKISGEPNLFGEALLAGWPTARANDGTGSKEPPNRKGGPSLKQVAGWSTPTTRDHKDGGGDLSASMVRKDGKIRNDTISRQAFGIHSILSTAQTENRGALNPNLPRWLQGYPVEWCQAAIRALRKLKTVRKAALRD